MINITDRKIANRDRVDGTDPELAVVGANVVYDPSFKTAKAGEKLTPQSFGFMAILTYP